MPTSTSTNHALPLTLSLALAAVSLVCACGPQQCETAEPSDAAGDSGGTLVDWVPDESLESLAEAQSHEADAPQPDPYADLSEEERVERAKVLYAEAEEAAKAEDWMQAKIKYEEAYHLVPNKHGLAYKVANAAVEVGDCEKARVFFEHYLIYGELERHEAQLHSALAKHRALECT